MNPSQSGYEMFFRSVQRKLLFIIFHVVDIIVSIVHVVDAKFLFKFFFRRDWTI